MNEKLTLKMGNFIYFNTAGPEAVLLVWQQGKVVAEERWEAHRTLSSTLSKNYLQILEKAGLSQKELTGVTVFAGPGSFTGLRIGVSFANALAFGLGIPMYMADEKGQIDFSRPYQIITPHYGAEPNITKPRVR